MSSREVPEHEPTVSVSRSDMHSVDDHVGIQDQAQGSPTVERHMEPLDNAEPSETKKDNVRDRASRRTINRKHDPMDHIPRSLRVSSHRRRVGMHDDDHQKDDTSPEPLPRSCRGIGSNHASHRSTPAESGSVDRLTRDFSSIKLEDRAVRNRQQHISSRLRQSPYGRNHERRRIIEESRSHRPWKPTPESCRPGLQLNQENFNKAKALIMYVVLSGKFPAEYWVAVGLSREAIFYAFTELGLQLPPNISFDGLVPYAKANEDGFDNEACKLRVWDEFRAEQLVTLECDEDTGAFEFIWLAFFIFLSKY